MKKEEKIKLFIDTFPEVYEALEQYANSEGYTGISRYIRGKIESIIDYFEHLSPL